MFAFPIVMLMTLLTIPADFTLSIHSFIHSFLSNQMAPLPFPPPTHTPHTHTHKGWSISLFHYRNHGHDFGRVLVGLLVEDRNKEAFASFLDNLGYTYVDETENAAYKQFLK